MSTYTTKRTQQEWDRIALHHGRLKREFVTQPDGSLILVLTSQDENLLWDVFPNGRVDLHFSPHRDRHYECIATGRDAEVSLENAIADSSPLAAGPIGA